MSGTLRLMDAGRPFVRRAAITLTALSLGTLALVVAILERDASPILEFKSSYFISALDYSPDGRQLASGSTDGKLKIWDAETGALVRGIAADEDGVNSVSFSPDGSLIASGGRDGVVKIWEAQTGKLKHALNGHNDQIDAVHFSPDGHLLASVGADNSVRLWDPDSGTLSKTLDGHKSNVRVLAFSPYGHLLATGDGGGTIKIWDVSDGSVKTSIDVPFAAGQSGTTIFSISFAPDGKLLASGSDDHTVRIWDVSTGLLDKSFEAASRPDMLAFAPYMRLLATAGFRGQLWDLSTGAPGVRKSFAAYPIVFSPDGHRLAGADNQANTIKIWDVD